MCFTIQIQKKQELLHFLANPPPFFISLIIAMAYFLSNSQSLVLMVFIFDLCLWINGETVLYWILECVLGMVAYAG